MRVVVPARVARDLRAFHPGRVRPQVQIVHRDENAPLRRLETIADIGQRTADNDAHRVGQIARPHLVLNVENANSFRRLTAIVRQFVTPSQAIICEPTPPSPHDLEILSDRGGFHKRAQRERHGTWSVVTARKMSRLRTRPRGWKTARNQANRRSISRTSASNRASSRTGRAAVGSNAPTSGTQLLQPV